MGTHKLTDEEHLKHVAGKRQRRMAVVDSYPADIRQLVHEYGLTIVQAFLDHGVTKANAIRHIVERVLDEFSPTRGSYTRQGIRTEVLPALNPQQQEQK